MSKPFLGVGTAFPLSLDARTRGLARAEYEQSVRQSILVILGTAKGERVMRPDFGCGIHDLIFATNSGETAGRVASEVRQALILWEPRIDVLGVSAGSDEAEPTRLLIQIEYRVRATNNRFNLVYPFYVE